MAALAAVVAVPLAETEETLLLPWALAAGAAVMEPLAAARQY